MILVRSPLRITLGGGGTDIPSYYRKHGGFTVSATISKYVYIGVVNPFTPGLYLKHSIIENVDGVDDVTHPLLRECLKTMGVDRVAVTTFADIPANTGLGSSGAFTCALLKALAVYTRRSMSTHDLATLACDVELYRVGDLGGKQDQFTSAYGGVNTLAFDPYDGVIVTPLRLSPEVMRDLEDHLMLFYTGVTRTSASVQSTVGVDDNLHQVKLLGGQSANALSVGAMDMFAEGLNRQWDLKESRVPSPPSVVELRQRGLHGGALGCKVVGAGGGGFLMFYTPDPSRLRDALASTPLVETRFNFDFEGTRVVTT